MKRLNRHELEFLPAVLEIQETPPSPVGRVLGWALIILFAVGVGWACIGKIDIVAVAHGKIIPGDRVKMVQPLDTGTVRAIHVYEGQAVNKGDVLIELDSTVSGADRERLAKELIATRLEAARLQSLSRNLNALNPSDIPDDADPEPVELQEQILRGQLHEQSARLAEIENSVRQRNAEYAATQNVIDKLEATLPLVTRRAEALRALADKKLMSEQSYLELEQQRIEKQQDLAAQRNHLHEVSAAKAAEEQKRAALEAEFKRTVLTDLARARDNVTALSQELIKAIQRTSEQRLTAPVAGVVQQLAVHTIGGVVTPAQNLMVIVPQEHALEVEAAVENQDIGFVRDGQKAEIKVETFPFTRYGTIDAEILHVSNDAIADEQRGLIYTARVLMKKSVMQVEDRLVNLTPGMAVTVEIKTGKRRLIEYFLSPLLQYTRESVRER